MKRLVIGLALALTTLQAFAPSPADAAPATVGEPSSAAQAKLTPELLAKILHYISVAAIDREAPAVVASALGLTAPGIKWADRQVAATHIADAASHSIAISRGTDQDLLLTKLQNGTLLVFRVQRDGALVSALTFDVPQQKLTMRIPAEAQADLTAEYAYWTEAIDEVMADAVAKKALH
jgi:hypothetical protein